jgi:hypothetical protein
MALWKLSEPSQRGRSKQGRFRPFCYLVLAFHSGTQERQKEILEGQVLSSGSIHIILKSRTMAFNPSQSQEPTISITFILA